MKSVNKFCDALRESGDRDAQPNDRGNQVFRACHSTSRYVIDFADDFTAGGWLQYDTNQDAAYFGCWVNPVHRLVLTYAEGDWSLVECPTDETYNAEIESMNAFYGEGFICKTFDAWGIRTHRQDRSQFVKPSSSEADHA